MGAIRSRLSAYLWLFEQSRPGRWLARNRGPLLLMVVVAIIVDTIVLVWGLLA